MVSLVALAVYRWLSPSVSGFGDSSELALVLATNGVPHPTGYPLYVLFGHLFVRALHAAGMDWPAAAVAWSQTGAAVAVYFLQVLAWQMTGAARHAGRRVRAGAAVLAAGAYALNPIWLEQTTLTEVYSWHVAWACGTASLFLTLVQMGDGSSGRPRSWGVGAAALWGLLAGAGLAHHRTSLLLAAPLSVALFIQLTRESGLRRAATFTCVSLFAALVPLSGYAVTAWRAFHPGAVHWPALEPSWSSVWQHLSARIYWENLGYFAPGPDARHLLARWGYPLLGPGLALLVLMPVLAGGTLLRPALGTLAAGAALAAIAAFRYGIPDPRRTS